MDNTNPLKDMLIARRIQAVSRRRYQRPEVQWDKDRWTARYREDVLDPTTGQVTRPRKVWYGDGKLNKRTAQRELDQFLSEINREDYRPTADGVTFAKFADKWMKTVMIHHKPSSQDGERSTINVNLLPAFGEMPLKEITAEAIQLFVNQWRKSPKTLRNAINLMMGMWDHAKAWGYCDHNPFPRGTNGKLLLRMPAQVKAETYNFSLEETLAIIAEAPDEKTRLLFRTLAEGGMRPGELAGMRKTDLEGRIISLSQSVYRQKIQTPKTKNAVRAFTVSQELADDLRAYMASTEGQKNNYNLVWTNGNGNPYPMDKMPAEVLNPILEKLGIREKLEKMGIRKCGNYAFRHMNVTEMRRRNVPLKTIQKRVGHAIGSDVTDRHYAHAVDADDLAASDLLGALLNKAEGTIQ